MNTNTVARLFAAVAVTGLVLAGCGGDAEPGGNTGSPTQGTGSSPTAGASTGEHNEADVAFAQGMIPHHRQAVVMSELAVNRTDSPEILDLAGRIGAAQQPEIDTMTGWLEEWGAEVPATGEMGGMGGDMGGMDHGEMGGMDHGGMSGMMTPEQMSQLQQASGPGFDRMFLEMMTEHHEGAVEMAEAQLAEGSDPRALELAQEIIDTQQAEIDEMEELLAQI